MGVEQEMRKMINRKDDMKIMSEIIEKYKGTGVYTVGRDGTYLKVDSVPKPVVERNPGETTADYVFGKNGRDARDVELLELAYRKKPRISERAAKLIETAENASIYDTLKPVSKEKDGSEDTAGILAEGNETLRKEQLYESQDNRDNLYGITLRRVLDTGIIPKTKAEVDDLFDTVRDIRLNGITGLNNYLNKSEKAMHKTGKRTYELSPEYIKASAESFAKDHTDFRLTLLKQKESAEEIFKDMVDIESQNFFYDTEMHSKPFYIDMLKELLSNKQSYINLIEQEKFRIGVRHGNSLLAAIRYEQQERGLQTNSIEQSKEIIPAPKYAPLSTLRDIACQADIPIEQKFKEIITASKYASMSTLLEMARQADTPVEQKPKIILPKSVSIRYPTERAHEADNYKDLFKKNGKAGTYDSNFTNWKDSRGK